MPTSKSFLLLFFKKEGLPAFLVLLFAVLVCLRLPGPVLYGRLWAEEGAVFYPNAASLPWRTALLAPFGGYLNLVANAAPMLARHIVKLEYVPWITELIALIFQCCPAVILATSQDEWLRPPPVRAAAVLLLATAPVTEQVFLHTLHSQFHLALCAALILALDIPGRRLGFFYGALLLLAPLCGPAGCLLAPLFCARAAIDRSRPRALQAALIGAGAALQFLLFYTPIPTRGGGTGPILLLCIVYLKQIVTPLLGRAASQHVAESLREQIALHRFPWQAVLVTGTAFMLFTVALLRRRHAASVWMFACACLLAPIAYCNALLGGRLLLIIGNGARYNFLPELLCALALLGIASGTTPPERWIARGAVVWLLLVGVHDIPDAMEYLNSGPSWAREVALWRHDHAHHIALWPAGWTMTLESE
jgi:hypothetical protein